MQPRLDGKLALLYTLLVLQVLIVMIYVATTPSSELTMSTTHTSVTFVKFEEQQVRYKLFYMLFLSLTKMLSIYYISGTKNSTNYS